MKVAFNVLRRVGALGECAREWYHPEDGKVVLRLRFVAGGKLFT
jgi:hypothetical protein